MTEISEDTFIEFGQPGLPRGSVLRKSKKQSPPISNQPIAVTTRNFCTRAGSRKLKVTRVVFVGSEISRAPSGAGRIGSV